MSLADDIAIVKNHFPHARAIHSRSLDQTTPWRIDSRTDVSFPLCRTSTESWAIAAACIREAIWIGKKSEF